MDPRNTFYTIIHLTVPFKCFSVFFSFFCALWVCISCTAVYIILE
jgi:hypothetical protein